MGRTPEHQDVGGYRHMSDEALETTIKASDDFAEVLALMDWHLTHGGPAGVRLAREAVQHLRLNVVPVFQAHSVAAAAEMLRRSKEAGRGN